MPTCHQDLSLSCVWMGSPQRVLESAVVMGIAHSNNRNSLGEHSFGRRGGLSHGEVQPMEVVDTVSKWPHEWLRWG